MNWEITDALIRLENQMYGVYNDSGHSPMNDRYAIEECIKQLERELAAAQKAE